MREVTRVFKTLIYPENEYYELFLPINDFLLLQRKSFKNKKAHSFRGGMNCDQIIF